MGKFDKLWDRYGVGERMEKEYVPHVIEEGSREHVISYIGGSFGSFEKCNIENCEINKRWDEHRKDVLERLTLMAFSESE
jgi:hypothetical protein